MAAPNRQVLSAYRELVSLIRRLPRDRAEAGLAEARAAIRANRDVAGEAEALDMLKELHGRISFLRMTVPRTHRDSSRGAGVYVMRDGELVEGRGRAEGRVADGVLDWETAHKWHNRQLKRFNFGRDPTPGQFGPF